MNQNPTLNQTPDGVLAFIRTNAGLFEMGQIFEAETTKGGKNLIVFMFLKDGWAYYCHGHRGKKVRIDDFQRAIDYGDLVPKKREDIEPERLSIAVLNMMAMSQGLNFNDYMRVFHGYGEGSQVY